VLKAAQQAEEPRWSQLSRVSVAAMAAVPSSAPDPAPVITLHRLITSLCLIDDEKS
jgi:hypothetical protein